MCIRDSYYAINDRAAGRRVIELELMTVDQHNQIPEDEEMCIRDRHSTALKVEVFSSRGRRRGEDVAFHAAENVNRLVRNYLQAVPNGGQAAFRAI